jgi:hypothetical protein
VTTAARDAADWRLRAACRGQDTNQWFGRPHQTTHAIAICQPCPVRAECLHECMQVEVPTYRYGVYGGLTAADRRALPELPTNPAAALSALRTLLALAERTDPPMTTAPAHPVADVELKTTADVRLKAIAETSELPVGKLLTWADQHPDPEVYKQAVRAREALASLRQRHAADQELTAITTEAEQLEKRLAELRAREAELAPAKPKRKRGSYARDYDTREVRAWADANGIDCPRVGQIPKRVLDAWRAREPK